MPTSEKSKLPIVSNSNSVLKQRLAPIALFSGLSGALVCIALGQTLLSLLFLLVALASGWRVVIKRIHNHEESNDDSTQNNTKQLKHLISKLKYLTPTHEPWVEQALQQLKQCTERYSDFNQILSDKFEPTELTYSRYFSTAQLVYYSVMNCFSQFGQKFTQWSSMNPPSIQSQLAQMKNQKDETSDIFMALSERSRIAQHLETEIQDILAFNEKAITELDRVTHALSEITTSKSTTPGRIDDVMLELRALSERAKKYSNSGK